MSQHHYNPDWLSDDDLLSNFVARTQEFDFLREELARIPSVGTVQHYLLIGLRGAGKTTLLKRLAIAIRREPALQTRLIALSFPEELYQIKNLDDFWWACCEALLDELDREGNTTAIKQLEADMAQAADDQGLTLLLKHCQHLQRRPVLLVDNLDMLFERIDKTGRKLKDPHAAAYWALREVLSSNTTPVVIGGTVRLSEPFTDYDKAFFDFFTPKRLGKLPLDEVKRVLAQLAQAQNLPQVQQRIQENPARLHALYELTGGNPRAIGLIFELLRSGANSRAVQDFERLMDITTPYYKARIEDLSEQAQVLMHGLAVCKQTKLAFGYTAAELAEHCKLDTTSVSAQLTILEREGLVEKSADHGRTQYRIAEQLFRLWLQMRSNRRVRQNVIWLTEFLEALFDFEEIQSGNSHRASALAHGKFLFGIAGTEYACESRHIYEAHAVQQVEHHVREQGGEMDEYISDSDVSEHIAQLTQLRTQLQNIPNCGLTTAEQTALLGSLNLRLEQKQHYVNALSQGDSSILDEIRKRLQIERGKLLRCGLLENELDLLFGTLQSGALKLPYLTPQQAETECGFQAEKAAFRSMIWHLVGAREWVKFAQERDAQNWLDWGGQYAQGESATAWANVAGAMRRSKQYDCAERTLQVAAEKGMVARVKFEQAVLLDEFKNDRVAAEACIHEAIELDPADALSWYAQGYLLAEQSGREAEAEAAYRAAIKLDPAYAWPWNNLGILLAKQAGREAEAEAAYREAIKLDSALAWPWNNLGNLLAKQSGREAAAEAAYRAAIKLDPAYALPRLNLGRFFARRDQLEAAEQAYAQGIALEPNLHPWWQAEYTIVQIRLAAAQQTPVTPVLSQLLALSEQLPELFVDTEFIEHFLAKLIPHPEQAQQVFNAMRELEFDKRARPMMLAFEAACMQQAQMLEVLSPELREASMRIYRRLIGKKAEA